MRRLARYGVTLALAAALAPAAPAHAAPLNLVALGQAKYSPGLTNVPTFQSVHVTFSLMAGAAGGAVAATGCQFVGASSIAETTLVGHGSGVLGNCASGSVSGTLSYARTGLLVQFTGTLVVDGQPYLVGTSRSHGGGHCMYVMMDGPVGTTYAVICDFLYP